MVKQSLFVTLFVSVFSCQLQATYLEHIEKNDNGSTFQDAQLTDAVARGELCTIVRLIEGGESLEAKTTEGLTLFELACSNNYGLIGACIQQVVDKNWDINFLLELFKHLDYCCCGKELVLSPEGVSNEQFERYTQALTSCVEMVISRSN